MCVRLYVFLYCWICAFAKPFPLSFTLALSLRLYRHGNRINGSFFGLYNLIVLKPYIHFRSVVHYFWIVHVHLIYSCAIMHMPFDGESICASLYGFFCVLWINPFKCIKCTINQKKKSEQKRPTKRRTFPLKLCNTCIPSGCFSDHNVIDVPFHT